MRIKVIILTVLAILAMCIPSSVMAVSPTATPVQGYSNAVLLENKDPNTWLIISDSRSGVLSFNPTGATFQFSFTGQGLENVPYSLIYFANPYPGNYPGALIGTGTAVGGVLTLSGNLTLSINLPQPPDSNMLVSHAGPPDNYTHAFGAKIWLVPSDCYNATTKQISTWSPTRFLFETDLITYTNTALSGTPTALSTTITEPAATIGLTVSPPTLNFGSVAIGACSADNAITLSNTGNVSIKVTATTSAGYYAECLKINNAVANGWVSPSIPAGSSLVIQVKSCPTQAYSGTVTGNISFIASFAQ